MFFLDTGPYTLPLPDEERVKVAGDGEMARRTRQRPSAGPRPFLPDRGFQFLQTQTIYCGDNLDKLPDLPDRCIDLIYIDPPFNSNRNYEVFWGEVREVRSFNDRHESTKAYIDYMYPRCKQLARVLKPTGSFYFHCDWHASHYAKVMLDGLFGENNFQNEIVWQRTGSRSDAHRWNTVHDTIFFYSGSGSFAWNPQVVPHTDDYIESKYTHTDADGRLYCLDNMTSPNPRRNMMYEWKGHASPEKGWRYSRETMEKLDRQGRIWYPADKSKRPRLKRYLDEMPGVSLGTVWTDIPPVNSQANERIGYPTQKPVALLERIIKASSDPDDIVLDAFCGCGTTLEAAQKLGRRWIGIDFSPTACRVMSDRLQKECLLQEGKDFEVCGLPRHPDLLRRMPAFEFENWAVIELGGEPNKAKVGDKGIDGRIFPVSAMPGDREPGTLGFMDTWYPIQVKQKDKAGRQDIDLFVAAMIRAKRKKGFFVSFDFTSDAKKEMWSVLRNTGCEIVPVTVDQILKGDIPLTLTS
jgi:DNA modification methylase